MLGKNRDTYFIYNKGQVISTISKLFEYNILGLETKASICSTIKQNLILACRMFSAFFVAVIN